MNKKFIINSTEFSQMCKRAAYAIGKNHPSPNLSGYNIKVSDCDELEISGTDGFRISYQIKQSGKLDGEPWVAVVSKSLFEATIQVNPYSDIALSLSDDAQLVTIQNTHNLDESVFCPVSGKPFSFESTYTVARGKPSIADTTLSVEEFRAMLHKVMHTLPSTYKDIDNDRLMFFYMCGNENSYQLKTGAGYPPEYENFAWTSIQKKFISETAKVLVKKGNIRVRFAASKNGHFPMIIIEDENGGHGIMPMRYKKKVKISQLPGGFYFRIPGEEATLCVANGISRIEEGSLSDDWAQYKYIPNQSTHYQFPDDLMVFEEDYDERKARERRSRRKR